eukprot:GEMP01021303.1.p1 GENE.GEMP01021303.1~~GEMP01021303.1.p1  ORF type:complete len:775 (+),score=122.08 GEMP01021303.1:256-2580(+)
MQSLVALDEAAALKKTGQQFEDMGDWGLAKDAYIRAAEKIIHAKKQVPPERQHLFKEPLADIIRHAEEVAAKVGKATSSKDSGRRNVAELQPLLSRSHTEDLLDLGRAAVSAKDYAAASKQLEMAYDRVCETNPDKAKEIEGILECLSNLQIHDKVDPKIAVLSNQEKEILKRSSCINGKMFLPWAESDSFVERAPGQLFVDPDGVLTLAEKQQRHFKAWSRTPKEFNREQKYLCSDLSAGNIKQTLVGDCSFVSALAVCCYWEFRFPGKKVVTHNIFPQDPQLRPLVNGKGKYVVRLFVNGIWRKVVVDDLFPVDNRNSVLTSLSKNGDMWVSIYEKAFLKVHGGYHFPGSITSYDIYALTGWPPEEIHLALTPQANLWNILQTGKRKGQCLIASGTRTMTPEEEEKCGLAGCHAYAILEVGEFEGHKLLLLKNPWSSKRWRGKFSPEDTVNWTPALKKQLQYDDLTSDVDRGLFWMDLNSLCQHFAHLSLNWNTNLFPYQVDRHFGVPLAAETEPYSLGGNAQLSVTVEYGKTPAIIWFIISQHTTDFQNEAAMDFITAHVYKSSRPFSRIYHAGFAFITGVYTNAPHESVKLQPEPKDGKHFTIVPSRWCTKRPKREMLDFTIRIFSTVPISVDFIPQHWKFMKRIAAQWKGLTAGGSCSDQTFRNNPQYAVKFLDATRPANVRAVLSTDVEVHAAVHIIRPNKGVIGRVERLYRDDCLHNSPHWRGRFCVSELFDLTQDIQVIACCEKQGQEAPFTIDFESNVPIEIVLL